MAFALRIRGLVQGVGFRPAVWHVANKLGLTGNVRNDGEGVLVRLTTADIGRMEAFIHTLRAQLPPLARIDSIQTHEIADFQRTSFDIVASAATTPLTGIVPDAATCPDCLAELRDPNDRRYRYPFINCTHCGPRLSIIRAIPYDRANTSMAVFPLCSRCAAEYVDPADRRYHAQPNACPVCGPQLTIAGGGNQDPLTTAQACLRSGGILALKGIGGFHLACDAENVEAVRELRRRKRRHAKPFALMARDIEVVKRYAHLDELAADALCSPAAPIVLLQRKQQHKLPGDLAPDSRELGFMLPYSPLHHLLLEPWDTPLVMTSGNLSDEPQCIDNEEAIHRLGELADTVLLHDREIVNRVDDSVLRVMAGRPRPLRRARGYAPAPLRLHESFATADHLLALGGDLKNTFCLLDGRNATLSQHLGDLSEARARDAFEHTVQLYLDLFAFEPSAIAVDLHPGYHGHQHGSALAKALDAPLLQIQHHHAHIASVMAESGLSIDHPPVIGIALDGMGFGDDGMLWGGEVLLADFRHSRRLAHLEKIPLPGGDRAALEPWRNLYARLQQHGQLEAILQRHASLPACAHLRQQPLEMLQNMLTRQLNSPLSSSTGRLFDAVAAALDLHKESLHHEGQAAMALEQLALEADPGCPPYPLQIDRSGELPVIVTSSLWPTLFADIDKGRRTKEIARAFHHGLADCLLDLATGLASEHQTRFVALSGGVLQNRLLLERLNQGLRAQGLETLVHEQVPANDGGISLGQAAIAAARLAQRGRQSAPPRSR